LSIAEQIELYENLNKVSENTIDKSLTSD